MNRATSIVTPPSQLMIAVHVMPGDDGCGPILDYLRVHRDVLSRTNPITNLTLDSNRRFVLEGPYPQSAAEIVAEARIPPQYVTHVLVMVPGMYGQIEPGDALSNVPAIVRENQPTAFAIGRIDLFDPEARNVHRFDDLPEKARRMVSYYESYYDRTVLFIGTSPERVIDRSNGYAPGT